MKTNDDRRRLIKIEENLVSIIVPVYNAKNYLEKCINSLINQIYKNIEIILVDDGSTDGSSEICDFYSKKDNRIRVIHQKNSGPSHARNVGIDNANGDFICFVDSDDYIVDSMIDIITTDMLREDVSICAYDLTYYRDMLGVDSGGEILNINDAISRLLDDHGYMSYACNRMYSRRTFDDIRFPEGMFYEDIIFDYNLFKCVDRIYYHHIFLYCYSKRNDSITHSSTDRDNELVDAINYVFNDAKDNNYLSANLMLGYCNYYLTFIKKEVRNNRYPQEDIRYLKSFIRKYYRDIKNEQAVGSRKKIEMLFFFKHTKFYFLVIRTIYLDKIRKLLGKR